MGIVTSKQQPDPTQPEPTCPHRPEDNTGVNVITVAAETKGDSIPSDGPAGRLVVDGEPIEVWAEPLDGGLVRIDLCTTGGMGCGEAELANGSLHIDLPDAWSPADKATAACLIARIAYLADAA
ncbi:hypothetical protein [Dactylosporangium darangshiense]|uniref:Uncharacterized protein n=1 Tax=Dactylosporangium darangshiense TaxID=579108 RepID=A0ABP8DMV2_9ACTN